MPEGLAVSISSLNAGLGKRFYASLVRIRAGLFVISDEIIPDTHRNGHERGATMGLMVGALVMLYLDVTLG